MSKMGEENSIFVRLLIQRTSTKNFYFILSPKSAVRVLYLVRILYPVRSPQSAVRSPQSIFYTDRIIYRHPVARYLISKDALFLSLSVKYRV